VENCMFVGISTATSAERLRTDCFVERHEVPRDMRDTPPEGRVTRRFFARMQRPRAMALTRNLSDRHAEIAAISLIVSLLVISVSSFSLSNPCLEYTYREGRTLRALAARGISDTTSFQEISTADPTRIFCNVLSKINAPQ
jgi:hypothetical protein